MRPLECAPFKQQLLQQRESLLDRLRQLRGGDSRVGAASAHLGQAEDSFAQALGERELEMILDERESAEIDAIDAALERIEDGSYGQCAECGGQIALARLQAAPQAQRCIACQGQYESRPPAPSAH